MQLCKIAFLSSAFAGSPRETAETVCGSTCSQLQRATGFNVQCLLWMPKVYLIQFWRTWHVYILDHANKNHEYLFSDFETFFDQCFVDFWWAWDFLAFRIVPKIWHVQKNSCYLEPLRFSISSSWSDWCLQQLPSTNLVNSFRRGYPCLRIYPEQGVKDCKTWLSFCLAFVLRAGRAKWQCYRGWQTSAKPVRESS